MKTLFSPYMVRSVFGAVLRGLVPKFLALGGFRVRGTRFRGQIFTTVPRTMPKRGTVI